MIHDSLNYVGGAELVCLKVIEGLKEAGDEVLLGTIQKTNWGKVERTFGRTIRPDLEISLLPCGTSVLRNYTSLASNLLFARVRSRCELTLCTIEELMLLPVDVGYAHYLPACLANASPTKSLSAWHDIYVRLFAGLQRRRLRNLEGVSLLVNSRFTRDATERAGIKCDSVVYPPVSFRQESASKPLEERRNAVLTVGRYSPEKNFDFVLDLAKAMPKVRFTISGTFSGGLSLSYFRHLTNLRTAMSLDNVELVHDAPRGTLLKAMGASSFFLSSNLNEHFGLALVEAMAAGLIPLVWRSGGPWTDILQQTEGVYGYSFAGLDEAAAVLERLIRNPGELEGLRKRNRMLVRRLFSEDTFKKRIVEEVAKHSGGIAVTP